MPHFVTTTVVGWADALSREAYKEIILDSLKYCQQNKGLVIHAWVIMNNHLHMIVSATNDHELPDIMRDFKKFTSRSLVNAIDQNPQESRKEWLMNMFRFAGNGNNANERYQFWQQDYHPVALANGDVARQRLNYLHENPVRAGIVWEPQHYKFSSAVDYFENKPGLLKVDMLF
jgi:REP element-mobilizing transposase RayT